MVISYYHDCDTVTCTRIACSDVDEIRTLMYPYPIFPNRTETHYRREPRYAVPNILANIYLLKTEAN
jgi:hypothetical protein